LTYSQLLLLLLLCQQSLNQVKPKTDVEARVYEALSHKNWGTSSTLLNEIARDTYDYDRFPVVSRLMWEALENQRPAAWRVVFKGLTMLEHMVKNGSERCVDDARNHGHVLRSLQQFNYYEGTIDRGLGVREKSKQMLEILGDDDSIREERQKARKLREKFGGKLSAAAGGGGGGEGGGGGNSSYGGYGNQGGWENGGGGGASGGYGDGGIGSTSNRNAAYDNGGGFSGRYGGSESQPQGGTAPTFAALPPEGKKVKKSKKKGSSSSSKKKEGGAAATSEPGEFLQSLLRRVSSTDARSLNMALNFRYLFL
jgi:epsin